MLGWNISVYRQKNGGSGPGTGQADEAAMLAEWQTGFYGADWVFDLVKRGKATQLLGGGYPCLWTATARYVIPHLAEDANEVWVAGPYDILTDKWKGATVIDEATVVACGKDEWLLIEAWDES
jgi:hypothetical protein